MVTTIAKGMATTQQHQGNLVVFILNNSEAIFRYVGTIFVHLGVAVGVTWVNLVAILGHVEDIIVSGMASSSICSSNIQNKYMFETIKSFWLCPCRARKQHLETPMSSSIECTHFMNMHKSLGPCRARTDMFRNNNVIWHHIHTSHWKAQHALARPPSSENALAWNSSATKLICVNVDSGWTPTKTINS